MFFQNYDIAPLRGMVSFYLILSVLKITLFAEDALGLKLSVNNVLECISQCPSCHVRSTILPETKKTIRYIVGKKFTKNVFAVSYNKTYFYTNPPA